MQDYYWINDRWLTWWQTHALGYTKDEPRVFTAYDTSLNGVTVYQDISDNTYWNGVSWSRIFSDTGLWLGTSAHDTLYLCDKPFTFLRFKNTEEDPEPYSQHTAYSVDSKLVSYGDLHTTFGYTKTSSVPYIVASGVVKAWFNRELGLYWDDREGKKGWSRLPPVEGDPSPVDPGGQSTPVYPDPFIPLPSWEMDTQQLPTLLSSTGNFELSRENAMSQFVLLARPTWEPFQNTFNDKLID